MGNNNFNVKFDYFFSWPDRGIPSKQCQTILPLILLDKVNNRSHSEILGNDFQVRGSPTVIHCSAGIGRTGCLMALEVAHERIAKGKKVDFEQVSDGFALLNKGF